MVDELKALKDSLFRVVSAGILDPKDDGTRKGGLLDLNLRGAKDILGSLAAIAGQGKDEIVHIVCREIGNAVANMLKEPVTQILEGRKLQVTIELVPTNEKPRKTAKSGPKRKRQS